MSDIPNAGEILEAMVALAQHYEGQPVAVIANKDGEVAVGVLALYEPTEDEWMQLPGPLDTLPKTAQIVIT